MSLSSRPPNKAGFWNSSSSPFLPEFVPEMSLCVPEHLAEGVWAISKHQNYSFPCRSRLFCCLWVKHESFFPGLLFTLFFVLKQSHCCLLLCLGKKRGISLHTWPLVSVRYTWSVFLPVVCMGEAKNSFFPSALLSNRWKAINSASNCLMEIRLFLF